MQSLATLGLIGGMLCIMAARVAGPFGQDAPGSVLAEHKLGFRERLLLHRHSLYALSVVLLLGALTGAVSRTAELIGIAGAFAVVVGMPAVYRLTERGLALNRVVFRAWNEFDGVEETRTGVRLGGKAGMGAFAVICLTGAPRQTLRRRIEGLLQRGASGGVSGTAGTRRKVQS
ncbi:MAG TPA: hypothetical protein VFX49_04545 [Chloroflexota bacterium]|nr:hypothetical protein [Chloroflexota bacterium]